MKSLVAALFVVASLTLSGSPVKAQTMANEQQSSHALRILGLNSGVLATDKFDVSSTMSLSTLLENMIPRSTPQFKTRSTSLQACLLESAAIVGCTLTISVAHTDIEGRTTDSAIVIDYKVDLNANTLVGKPSFFIAG